jgi:general stress protein 26
MNLRDLYSFMAQFRLGVLSSVSASGAPQSALMGIAITPDLEIVFDTLQSSRKYANLSARPACSFVVGWSGEQTVQFEGIAAEVTGSERQRYLETYFTVWPEGRAHLEWPQITYIAVWPLWVRYSNYEQRPPLIEEFTFPVEQLRIC